MFTRSSILGSSPLQLHSKCHPVCLALTDPVHKALNTASSVTYFRHPTALHRS